MAKRVNWESIEHSYVCGTMTYRALAEKRGVPLSTLTEEAKKRRWVEKRKRFRDKVAAAASARACEDEADKLEAVRRTADRMAGQIEGMLADEKQLRMYTAVTQDGTIIEKELTAINTKSVRDLVASLRELTQVLRNLHSISTPAEAQAMEIARARLELERKKAEADAQGDAVVEVRLAAEAEELAK